MRDHPAAEDAASPAQRDTVAPALQGDVIPPTDPPGQIPSDLPGPIPSDPPGPIPSDLQASVLAWYETSGRQLAFRATDDAYAVLVSELMAQQTQASRAADAWERWMTRFPTVEALAAATPADVLRAWAGLGYNRRAINLHRTARLIVAEHGGQVPSTVDELMRLPGVGPYTARAVAAIAFGQAVGAVDTNVRRVLGRIVAGDRAGLAARELQRIADGAVPEGRAGDWTHALMDVGAGPCRATGPRCGDCPAERWCSHAAERRRWTSGGRRTESPPRTRSPRTEPPFSSTTRWLRGRVLARARDATDHGSWVAYREPIGSHATQAVREAVATLASEGLLEARETPDGIEARLPGAEPAARDGAAPSR